MDPTCARQVFLCQENSVNQRVARLEKKGRRNPVPLDVFGELIKKLVHHDTNYKASYNTPPRTCLLPVGVVLLWAQCKHSLASCSPCANITHVGLMAVLNAC